MKNKTQLTATDKGYFIIWYDLPESESLEYLDWLHTIYLPNKLKNKNIIYAAHYKSLKEVVHPGEKGRLSHTSSTEVPSGNQYILIFGGQDAHVFSNPLFSADDEKLSEEHRKLLGLRVGERSNIMVEEARVNGPEISTRSGMGLSPCIQLGNFNSGHWHEEDELTSWYAQWRMPSMEKLPGSVCTRKLVSVSGWAKHAILYEYTSVDARNKNFINHEQSNPQMEEWTDRVVRKLNHAPGSPNLANRIWPLV